MIGKTTKCINCANYHYSTPGFTCVAYPDGIPDAIIDGQHDHSKPFPDDNGIRYEPINDVTRQHNRSE